MVSAHILALYLGVKAHTHSKETVKSLRLFKQIYRHLLNAIVMVFA